MLSVIMQSVVMPSVVAPFSSETFETFEIVGDSKLIKNMGQIL